MGLKEIIEEEQKIHRSNYARVGSLFDDYEEASFITFSGHFHIKFENGYEVSLFNGEGSYTDNITSTVYDDKIYSKYIEVAIIKDGYFHTRDFVKTNDDDVLGLVKSDELIDILDKVKRK